MENTGKSNNKTTISEILRHVDYPGSYRLVLLLVTTSVEPLHYQITTIEEKSLHLHPNSKYTSLYNFSIHLEENKEMGLYLFVFLQMYESGGRSFYIFLKGRKYYPKIKIQAVS